MNLDRALERARSVSSAKSAAALYNDLNYELALGDPSSSEEQEGEQAQALLRERFPGVEQQANEVEQPPAMSRSARRNMTDVSGAPAGRRGSSRRGGHAARRPHHHTAPAARRGGRAPSRTPASTRSSAPRRTTGGGGRSSSSIGVGSLTGGFDATDSALMLLRLILLLGVGYFVLTDRGAKALGTVLGGISGGIQMIVRPVDPLNGSSSSSSPAKGTPAPTVSVPGTSAAAPTSLRTANNPRGVAIVTGGQGASSASTAIAMAQQLIPTVKQSLGPYGGGTTP